MKKTLNWIKENPLKITIGLIVILLLINLRQCNSNKIATKKLQVAEQNIAALNDTIRIVKAKDGTTEANKLAFLVDKVSNLEKLSTQLAKEVKNTKGTVNYIVSAGTKIVHDTTHLPSTATVDSNSVVVNFKFDTAYSKGNSRSLAGYTKYGIKDKSSFAMLTKDSLNISFITGIKNLDKGKPEIFIRSNYPGFSPTSIDGAVLDPKLFSKKPKPKLFTVGLNIGYTPVTYSLNKKQFDFDATRFGASLGINVNLNRLFNKN